MEFGWWSANCLSVSKPIMCVGLRGESVGILRGRESLFHHLLTDRLEMSEERGKRGDGAPGM